MTLKLRGLSTAAPDFEAEFQRVLHWSEETDAAIEGRVAGIIADVRARGDAALRKTAWAVLGLTLAQPATGLGLAWLDVHPVFQVLHLWLGSLLVSALMLQAIVAFRAPPPASVPATG